jgi:hypothetical protein
VTEGKTLKRRVRARMSKTGERYTAARRQVLERIPVAEDAAAAAATAPAPTPPIEEPAPFRGPRRNSDETLVARTGHAWAHWFDVLDARGASELSHTEIARWLVAELDVDGWWAQEITVGYEYRIGRRSLGTRQDGHVITITKTVGVPAERLFSAFVDESLRAQWLPDMQLGFRTATTNRTARFDAGEGERLAIGFTAKGEAKSTVAIEHSRIADQVSADRAKALWRERLADLQRLLER